MLCRVVSRVVGWTSNLTCISAVKGLALLQMRGNPDGEDAALASLQLAQQGCWRVLMTAGAAETHAWQGYSLQGVIGQVTSWLDACWPSRMNTICRQIGLQNHNGGMERRSVPRGRALRVFELAWQRWV